MEYSKDIKPGDWVVYAPTHDGSISKVEIGVVKRLHELGDFAFVWYHSGDTAACTNMRDLIKLENAYSISALMKRFKQTHENL